MPRALELPTDLSLELVADGFSGPVAVRSAGDLSGRLFVVEQTGRIRLFNGTALEATPFLDLSSVIACCGEQGLLGLAFHPQYAANGRFYVDYTDTSGDTRVVEYQVSAGDPDVADPTSARVLLIVDQPYTNHNGGNLQFGRSHRHRFQEPSRNLFHWRRNRWLYHYRVLASIK